MILKSKHIYWYHEFGNIWSVLFDHICEEKVTIFIKNGLCLHKLKSEWETTVMNSLKRILKDSVMTKDIHQSKVHCIKITDIKNDEKVFKEFVEPLIVDWKNRDEKLVDGYSWIYEQFHSLISHSFHQRNYQISSQTILILKLEILTSLYIHLAWFITSHVW